MKINKLFWIFGLVFVISSASVFAFALSEIYRHPIFILIVNALVIGSILFMVQLFLIPNQDAKVKLVVWLATFGLTALIVWNFTPRGAAYFWEVGIIAKYLKLWLIVNTTIFSIGLYMVAGFLEVKLETAPGRYGLILVTIVLGAMMANSLGDKPLWDTDNFIKIKNYLFSGEHEETMPDGTKVKVGGILTLDKTDVFESRLFIFLISTILFVWFFNAYVGLGQQSSKLTYLMAFIIGANLAHKGATSGTIIGLAEAFAILIVGQQVSHGIAGPRLLSWLLSIVLVEWIFCAVFNQSRILLLLGGIIKQLLQTGAVAAFVVLYITWQSLRAQNPWVWLGTLVGGTLIMIVNKATGWIGNLAAGLINIDICGILSQHKIVASAAAGTGKVAGLIGGGAVSYAGFIPPDWANPIAVVVSLGTVIGGIWAFNHFRFR